jgi:APA family basic amino acid/polyamine antiporter
VGPGGAAAVKLGILASVEGALNGNIIARPRVTVALAADGLTFAPLGRLPVAICVQSAVAVALIFTLKSFDTLIEYFVATESLSLLGAVAALFVLRRKMADAERPFRVPFYPWTPLFFLAGMTAGVVALSWGEARQGKWHTLGGTAIVLAGFPIYFLWRRTLRRPTSAGPVA